MVKWQLLTYKNECVLRRRWVTNLWIGVIMCMLGAQADDIAVLTVQCWCPAVIFSHDGKLKKEGFARLHSSSLFFYLFFILHQVNTARWMEIEWISKWVMMSGMMRYEEEFHAWRMIRDSLCKKERPSANCRVPWYSSSEEILLITDIRLSCIRGCSSSRWRGACSWACLPIMSHLISCRKRISTFRVVASEIWRSIDGWGLLKTISRRVRTTAGMYSPEWWERARVSDLPAKSQILAE